MHLDERALRRVLRREAERVALPEYMWQRISRRLEEEQVRETIGPGWIARLGRWKEALVLTAAAGLFWLVGGPSLETITPPGPQAPFVTPYANSASPPPSDFLVETSRFVATAQPMVPDSPSAARVFIARHLISVQ